MTIGFVTYNFYPAINPRAFRAFELAKEFVNQGHEVIVFIPENDFDYSFLLQEFELLKIVKVTPGFLLNKSVKTNKIKPSKAGKEKPVLKSKTKLDFLKRKFIEWFYPGGFNFEFSFTCSKSIRNCGKEFDLFISIGLPINSHFGLRMAAWRNASLAKCKIADYGDPYSLNKTIKSPFFHVWFEKWILKKFDYIVVPTAKMTSSFLNFKSIDDILVLPQGLNLNEISTSAKLLSEDNGITVVTYAGVFYKDIRNPEEFFEYLVQINEDFILRIFTDVSNEENMALISPYMEKLKGKLEVYGLFSRLECIKKLSESDFLLNISNTTQEQTPSKLIDYKLSGRPTFSYSPGNFRPEILDEFFQKKYNSDATKEIDIEDFNIEKIVKELIKLSH